jgi:hypothetical protein
MPQRITAFDQLADDAITVVACGSRHSLALTRSGRVYSWGRGIYGQLGLGDTMDRHSPCRVPLPGGVEDDDDATFAAASAAAATAATGAGGSPGKRGKGQGQGVRCSPGSLRAVRIACGYVQTEHIYIIFSVATHIYTETCKVTH